MNDTSGAGADCLDAGNGTPTAAGYTDPYAWSIHDIAMNYSSRVFTSPEPIISDTTWDPEYGTCDADGSVVPFTNGRNNIEFEEGSEYDVRFSKFLGLGMAVVPSEGSGTIRDCVFMLNVRGVDYQSCTDHTVQNCLFMGNNMGVRDYNGYGGEVKNCTFDHNLYGVVFPGTESGTLTVTDCLFHTTETSSSVGHGISFRNTHENSSLTETNNAFYDNDYDYYDTTGTPGSVDLHETDWTDDTGAANAGLINGDPFATSWTDFADRFRIVQGNSAVDHGSSTTGTPFYTAALDNTADVDTIDIGYHYPRVVRFVDGGAGGDEDGRNWANAYTKLQDALDVAADDGVDVICVAGGTYKPDNNRSSSFVLVDGLTLYGGFEGTEDVFDFDMNGRDFDSTVLSGEIGTAALSDNCYHVVIGADKALIDGFTITKGYADGGGNDDYGGGMYNEDVSPAVTNCIFDDNSAKYGGGMFNDSSSPTITNCLIFNNKTISGGDGPGIYCYNYLYCVISLRNN